MYIYSLIETICVYSLIETSNAPLVLRQMGPGAGPVLVPSCSKIHSEGRITLISTGRQSTPALPVRPALATSRDPAHTAEHSCAQGGVYKKVMQRRCPLGWALCNSTNPNTRGLLS